MKTLLLKKDEVRRLIGMAEVIGAVEEAYKEPGRESDDEITIFDSTGMAIQDNTTASKIYQNATANDVGTFFQFFE